MDILNDHLMLKDISFPLHLSIFIATYNPALLAIASGGNKTVLAAVLKRV